MIRNDEIMRKSPRSLRFRAITSPCCWLMIRAWLTRRRRRTRPRPMPKKVVATIFLTLSLSSSSIAGLAVVVVIYYKSVTRNKMETRQIDVAAAATHGVCTAIQHPASTALVVLIFCISICNLRFNEAQCLLDVFIDKWLMLYLFVFWW